MGGAAPARGSAATQAQRVLPPPRILCCSCARACGIALAVSIPGSGEHPCVARRAHGRRACARTQSPLTELNQETFYPYLEEAGSTLVVVDFYTDWCGPCKVMLPELYKLQEEMPQIKVVKFNCNKANKDLVGVARAGQAAGCHSARCCARAGEDAGHQGGPHIPPVQEQGEGA